MNISTKVIDISCIIHQVTLSYLLKNKYCNLINAKRANRLQLKSVSSLFMNNFQMLPKRCCEASSKLKNPVLMRVFSVLGIIHTRLLQEL